MDKKKSLILISFVFVVFLSIFVMASFSLENIDVKSVYELGKNLDGNLEISFTSEPSDSELIAKFSNGKTSRIFLIDLLKKHANLNFDCDPESCKNNYLTTSIGEDSKTFIVVDEKFIGGKLNGEDVSINDFKISIESSTQSSCENQLSIDITGDGITNWENSLSSVEDCGSDKTSNCYTGSFDKWFRVVQRPYCEKIDLNKAPAFEIKAFMKVALDTSYESDLLQGSLYNPQKERVGTCNFPKPSESGKEVTCTIDYLSKESGEYFACVSLKEGSNIIGYELEARQSGNVCGFLGDPSQESETSGDYNIKIAEKKYAAVSSFTLDQESFLSQNSNSLIAYLNEYLLTRYNNNCPESGCIIPLVFSGKSQQIRADNFLVDYVFKGSGGVSDSKIYTLNANPAKITSGVLDLDLSLAELNLPNIVGNYTIELFLENEILDVKNITLLKNIPGVATVISPKIVAAANPTTFTIFTDSNIGNLEFQWDFGDGSETKNTIDKNVKYTYNNVGNYSIKVTSFRIGKEIGSNEFTITVNSPKKAINSTLIEYKKRLEKIKIQSDALPNTYQVMIEELGLKIDDLSFNLGDLESEYKALLKNSGTTDGDYISLMNQLITDFEVPLSIQASKINNLPFIYDLNDIVLEDIEDLFGEFYIRGKENEYRNEIGLWFLNNINSNIKQKTYTIFYETYEEEVVTEFDITISQKSNVGKAYLIIERDLDDLILSENYNLFDEPGVTGIELDLSTTNNINFALPGSVDLFELTMYVVPELRVLDIKESIKTEEKSFIPRFLITGSIFLVLFLILYIALQEWYKIKYEDFLFKNKNNLYNLLYFVQNAKAQKLSDDQIRNKLKSSKWKNEQVIYALKKFKGERIGMWEIPIFRKKEQKKMNEELKKRKRMARI